MRISAGLGTGWVLALVLTISGCATTQAPTPRTPVAGAGTSLVVALYPYVPRIGQFQATITDAWARARPDVALSFLPAEDWDGGYSDDPPANVDVYVFDAMFFEYFRSQNWLEPMTAGEIGDLDDFVAYAIDGVEVEDQYYAIPQLGCGNILFFQKDDEQLANATTLSEVEEALGLCSYTSEIPPDRRGLMVDMSGGTTNASLYLDTVHSVTGEYPPPLPWDRSQINWQAMGNLRLLLAMASYENGTADLAAYERGTWLSQGWGRALIGFTEAMSAMSAATRADLGFKMMPLSDHDTSTMFYADVIGVNTTTHQRGTRDLAVQLANVMASSGVMVASIGPDADHPYPQYLMATRPSVFQTLARSFPIYSEMYALITENEAVAFKLSSQSRAWLTAMKNTLRTEAREDYPCSCDYQAIQYIPDNRAAPAICNATCADHGGWSGQWTHQYPAAPVGSAVCGCGTCPSP